MLGARWGGLVFALDLLKGLAAVLAARLLLASGVSGDTSGAPSTLTLSLIAGVAAILGHVFTPWLRFRGGRGVATSLGVFLGIVPWPTLLAFLLWAVLFSLSKRVSVGSIGAAMAYPLLVWTLTRGDARTIVSIVAAAVAALVLVRHLPNIRRILSGTEPPTVSAPKGERP